MSDQHRPVRVAVTGAAGMLGRRVVEALQARHYHVTGLTRQDADLMDARATNAAFQRIRPELVVHLAARVAGLGGNLATPGQMFYENILINTNVIEAARKAGARKVVAVGSTAVYSDMVPLPMREDDIWLGPPHGSEAPYGNAKRAMLAQLEAYKLEYGLEYAYATLTNSFGPDDKFDENHGHVMPSLISKFHRAVTNKEDVTIWGTGTPQRDFIYSKDTAAALVTIMEKGAGAINVASGRETSIRAMVELMAEIAQFKGQILWDRSKPDGQALRKYDISRLSALGFTPRYDLRAGIAETFEWFSSNVGHTRR